jgi:WD40 repeat protein
MQRVEAEARWLGLLLGALGGLLFALARLLEWEPLDVGAGVCVVAAGVLTVTELLAERTRRARTPTVGQVLAGGGPRGAESTAVPAVIADFQGRDELRMVRARLLEPVPAFGWLTRLVAVSGPAGAGKTAIMVTVARDPAVRERFRDGIHWLRAGDPADLLDVQRRLLTALSAPSPALVSVRAGRDALAKILAERSCLVIVDGLVSPRDADAFRVDAGESRVVCVTLGDVAAEHDGRTIEVGPLAEPEARCLLASLAHVAPDALPAAADEALARTGLLAFNVALVGAAVGRGGASWEEAVASLDRAGSFNASQAAIDTLTPRLADLHRALAVYPADRPIPLPAVRRLWQGIGESLTSRDVRRALAELDAKKLITFDGAVISVHSSSRAFLLLMAPDPRLLHQDLLNAYGCGPEGPGWRALARDEPYIWGALVGHLVEAGEVAGIVLDLGFVALRCLQDGPGGAERDVRRAAATLHDPEPAGALVALLSQLAHRLTGLVRLETIVATLLANLEAAPGPEVVADLQQLVDGPLLVPVWRSPGPADRLVRVLPNGGRGVWTVVFLSDGYRVAFGSDDGTIAVWDVRDGRLVAELAGHEGAVLDLVVLPDDRLASLGADETVRVWDLSGEVEPVCWQIEHPDDSVSYALDVADDGRTAIIARSDGAHAVDLASGVHGRPIDDMPTAAVALALGGWRSARAGGPVRWDTKDGTARSSGPWPPVGHPGQVWRSAAGEPPHALLWALAWSPDSRQLAAGGEIQPLRLFDTETGAVAETPELLNIWGLAYSPDGEEIALATGDGEVQLRAAATGELRERLTGHRDRVMSVAFSSDGHLLAAAGEDGTVRIWDVRGDRAPAPVAIHAAALDPTGTTVTVVRADGSVVAHDCATGAQRWSTDPVAVSPSLVTSFGEQHVAVAADDGPVHLVDFATGRMCVVPSSAGPWHALSLSRDGRSVAGLAKDGAIHVLSTDGRATAVVIGARGMDWTPSWIAFDPTGDAIAWGGFQGPIWLIDARSGARRALLGHALRAISPRYGMVAGVISITYSATGDRMVSTDVFGDLLLWQLRRGRWGRRPAHRYSPLRYTRPGRRPNRFIQRHEGFATGAAFSPDGTSVAGAGEDGFLAITDLRTRELAVVGILDAKIDSVEWRGDHLAILANGRATVLEFRGHSAGNGAGTLPSNT